MPRSEMLRVNLNEIMGLWPFWHIGPGLRPQGEAAKVRTVMAVILVMLMTRTSGSGAQLV